MFRNTGETKQRQELLFEVHEKVADIATQIANEPSVGLYYVQQHVQKAVPALVEAKKLVVQGRDITGFVVDDVRAATSTIEGMQASGPATLERMRKDMERAYQALPALKALRGHSGSVLPTPRATPSSSPKKGSSPWRPFTTGKKEAIPKATDLQKVAQSLVGMQKRELRALDALQAAKAHAAIEGGASGSTG